MDIFRELTRGIKFDKNNKIKCSDKSSKKPSELKYILSGKKRKNENTEEKGEKRPKDDYATDEEVEKIKEQIAKLKESITGEETAEEVKDYEDRYKALINKKTEVVALMRKKFKIKVEGDRVPPPLDSFEKIQNLLKLDVSIMRRIQDQIKFKRPTPIQMQAIPIIAKKRDLIALAETGSGKSLSFILPLL